MLKRVLDTLYGHNAQWGADLKLAKRNGQTTADSSAGCLSNWGRIQTSHKTPANWELWKLISHFYWRWLENNVLFCVVWGRMLTWKGWTDAWKDVFQSLYAVPCCFLYLPGCDVVDETLCLVINCSPRHGIMFRDDYTGDSWHGMLQNMEIWGIIEWGVQELSGPDYW